MCAKFVGCNATQIDESFVMSAEARGYWVKGSDQSSNRSQANRIRLIAISFFSQMDQEISTR